MKRTLLFFTCFFYLITCYSQNNRNNIWYFGNYAGLNFNTNPPTVLHDGVLAQYEGCSSIADNNGNLLFYSKGDIVWNRNHVPMPNGTGLLGGNSSTQAVMIIPKPCNDSIYYIFTTPAIESGKDSLYYSVVDMTLNGGLGDIVTKNVLLHTGIKEKLTATLKSNGIDYWVVVKESDNDDFLAFSVTGAGVDPIPVTSSAGIPIEYGDEVGYMVISPDNTKLCAAYWGSSNTYLFDFNNATGIVSNPISFAVPSCYGVEFSPDNSKLYVTDVNNSNIHQYNLLAGSVTAIQNSDIVVGHLTGYGGALKTGPDDRIYVAGYNSFSISVINQPNLTGLACNFINQYINLAPGYCAFGLPNNLRQFSYCGICPVISNISSNASICANQTYQLPWGIIVSAPGVYSDTIKNQAATCDSIINTVNLSVYTATLLNTTTHICPNQTYQLPSGTIVSAEGIYLDTLTNIAGCDSIINTINLIVDDVSLQNTDAHICPGQTYQLPSGIIVSAEGIYIDTLRSQASCDSIINTIHLFIDHAVLQNIEAHICPNQTYMLPSGIIVSAEGTYVDTLRSQASCDSIINTIQLWIDDVSLQNTEAQICSNQHYQLPSGTIVNSSGTYIDTLRSQAQCDSIINTIHLVVNDLSFTSQVDSIFAGQNYTLPSGVIVSAPGTYQSVLANSLGCDSIITTTLILRKTIAECITLKNAITPNGDGINDYWVLYRYLCFKKLEVSVYNRYGSLVYRSWDYKNDWNGKYNNQELPDGTYYYVIKVFAHDGKLHVFRDNVTILR